jgi:hypothetical protein
MWKPSSLLKRLSTISISTTLALSSLLAISPAYALKFPARGGVGAPSHSIGGGVRSETCDPEGKPDLMPITPKNNVSTFVGDTVTLFFYVPDVGEKQANIFVDDLETWDLVYENLDLEITDTPGIFKVSFPAVDANGEPLVADRYYQWEFFVICDENDPARTLRARGWLQREDDGKYTTVEDYANAGIWQQVVTQVEADKCKDPSDWEELLMGQFEEEDAQALIDATLAECQASSQ